MGSGNCLPIHILEKKIIIVIFQMSELRNYLLEIVISEEVKIYLFLSANAYGLFPWVCATEHM